MNRVNLSLALAHPGVVEGGRWCLPSLSRVDSEGVAAGMGDEDEDLWYAGWGIEYSGRWGYELEMCQYGMWLYAYIPKLLEKSFSKVMLGGCVGSEHGHGRRSILRMDSTLW